MDEGAAPPPDGRHPSPPAEGSFAWHLQPAGGLARARFYTDGSLFEGTSPGLARLGWAFTAYDDRGQLVAAAYGAPPSWVRAIGGAEAWALLMATRYAEPGSAFITDSLGCKSTARAGVRWATGAARPQARVWRLLFNTFDSVDDAQAIERMPSHKSRAAIGVAERGDGAKITELDFEGNALADCLAKRGAAQYRVPLGIREAFAAAEREARDVAQFIGRVTWTANNVGEEPRRDSAPPPVARPGTSATTTGPSVASGRAVCPTWLALVARSSVATSSAAAAMGAGIA
jgi:hypothetical protein